MFIKIVRDLKKSSASRLYYIRMHCCGCLSMLQRMAKQAALTVGALSICVTAHATSLNVDAGSLLRQSEQDLNAQRPLPQTRSAPAKPSPKTSANEAVVFVKAFNFVGNQLITSAELSQSVAAYGDRNLTFAELKEAVDLVINTYREAGWTVRAYLPKQEITQGIVTVQVVEAVFGKVILPKESPDRVPTQTLIRMVNAAQPAGQAMSASGIDRALLLLDDLPGIQVAGHLVEGQKHGETDLLLSVTEEPWLSGNASFDNNGSISTGTERLNANLSVASPLRLGDALTTNFLKTQGSDYSRLAYSVPTGSEGWRTGVHTTLLNYHLLDKFAISGGYGAVYPQRDGKTP